MERTPTAELEKLLKLENVIFRGNTEDLNSMVETDPLFKRPVIPLKHPICYFWLCAKTSETGKIERQWVFWTRGENRPASRYIIAEDPVSSIEKQAHHHRDLVDALFVSEGKHQKYEYDMEVEDVDVRYSFDMFKMNTHYQAFNQGLKTDPNIGNWQENLFKLVVQARTDYYQERYRLSRNERHLAMIVFWKRLDWKTISTEHFSVMSMCFLKKMNLGFVEELLRANYN